MYFLHSHTYIHSLASEWIIFVLIIYAYKFVHVYMFAEADLKFLNQISANKATFN